jgi:HPr kinase/phosphorylase
VADLTPTAKILAGRAGLLREILSPQITVPDLTALPEKGTIPSVMHLRPSQVAHLCSLPVNERKRLIRTLLKRRPACVLLSGGQQCKELLDAAETSQVPVLKSTNLPALQRYLVNKLLSWVSLHGVLVRIFEIGVLIIGESAIGKSESALDLVLRGHKLVADDLVILQKKRSMITGRPPEMGIDLLQIRGLGIINIRALYGESATLDESSVGLVVELAEWKEGCQYSLVGLRERRYRILGVNLPYLKLPVKPGRNMATLIEVAARNQMLKKRGIFSARDVDRKLSKRLTG